MQALADFLALNMEGVCSESRLSIAIGTAIEMVCGQWKPRGSWPPPVLAQVVEPILKGHYQILVDDHGQPIAFASWSRLDDHDVNVALKLPNPTVWQRPSADDGTLWLVDVVLPPDARHAAIRELCSAGFRPEEHVAYVRYRADRTATHVRRFRASQRETTARPSRLAEMPMARCLSRDWVERSRVLGDAARLAALQGAGELPLLGIAGSLQRPILLGQYRILRSAGGRPEAFVSWAWLSAWSIEHKQLRDVRDLHWSEWDEGLDPCIVHVFCSGPDKNRLVEDFVTELRAKRVLGPVRRLAGIFEHNQSGRAEGLSLLCAASQGREEREDA